MDNDNVSTQPAPIPNENWHRIVGIIMLKFGVTYIEIFPDDVLRLGDGMSIVVDVSDGRFIVRVMPDEIFEQLVRETGGITA